MPRFSANLGHLYVEYPQIERIGHAAKAGFKAIELQNPYELAPSAVKAEIDRHGLTMLNLNTPPGRNDEPGLAAVPGRSAATRCTSFPASCRRTSAPRPRPFWSRT
jgi:hydroxypyruvate isomerase